MSILIASFDIGKKNFAFVIEEVNLNSVKSIKNIPKKQRYNKDGTCKYEFQDILNDLYKCGEVKLVCNLDLTYNCDSKKYLDKQTFINMNNELDKYKEYWDKCDAFIIERQMSFRNKRNTMAMKLGQHCYSYFTFYYANFKEIIDYPAYHKTQVLGAPKKFGKIEKTYKNGKTVQIKDNRKKWSVRIAEVILKLRNDEKVLEQLIKDTKRDDMSDCILMNVTYCYLKYLDKKKL